MTIADSLLPEVIRIARETAEIIMQYHRADFEVVRKTDLSPVTDADIAADRHIESQLAELSPRFPFLSEESADIPFEQRKNWQRYWLVDPLDGTREFIKGRDGFSVNIALIEDHQPILGVIFSPVWKTCYYAVKNAGAFKKSHSEAPVKIEVKAPCREQPVIAASEASQLHPSLQAFLQKLPHYKMISLGSSLKSCLIAEGVADLYPRMGETGEWDTAAAQIIVEEAGGCFVNLQQQPLRYNTKASLINDHFLVYGDKNKNWPGYFQQP